MRKEIITVGEIMQIRHDVNENRKAQEIKEQIEQTIVHVLNKSVDLLKSQYGCIPDDIHKAAILLVKHGKSDLSKIPYKFDELIKPYMDIADYIKISKPKPKHYEPRT